jgi:hypothetical protein
MKCPRHINVDINRDWLGCQKEDRICWWLSSVTHYNQWLQGGSADGKGQTPFFATVKKPVSAAALRKKHNFTRVQGCQMVYFQTENANFGTFWRVSQWKILVYFMAIRSILCSFGIFSPFLVCCTKKNLATLSTTTYVCTAYVESGCLKRRWLSKLWTCFFVASHCQILSFCIIRVLP